MALDTPKTSAGSRQQTELPVGQLIATAQQLAPLLLESADAEGLGLSDPTGQAELVNEVAALLFARTPGRPSIRVRVTRIGAQDASALEIINDDMPFLVDSVMGEILAQGIVVRSVLHPTIKAVRTPDGRLERLDGPGDRNWGDGRQESIIVVHLEPLDADRARRLTDAIGTTLTDVRVAVADWRAMLERLNGAIDALQNNPASDDTASRDEALHFLRWLRDGQFTFLGARDFRLAGDPSSGELVPVEGTGLGVLRDPTLHVLARGGDALAMTSEIRHYFFGPQPLIITKSSIQSRVHRRVLMDYIGIKRYGGDGALTGELRVVGLFTSAAYTQRASDIPLLRGKVAHVLAASGFAPGGHAGKALVNVIETFPRDELFRIGEDKLTAWSRAMVDLELRPRVRVFSRPDRFDRFVSVLVYAPRDRFSTGVRERIGAALASAFDAHVTTFTPYFPEGPLVRVHFILGRNPGPRPPVDDAALEQAITAITRTWDDQLADALSASSELPTQARSKYAGAFSAGYSETFPASRAVEDAARIERLGPDRPVAIDFYREPRMPPNRVRAAIYRFDTPISLSERVPVLENLGFTVIDERSYRVRPKFESGPREVALHDMVLETADGLPLDLSVHDRRVEDCFLAVLRGEADSDPFNRLIIASGADWREVAMLRSLAAYLRQIRSPFGPRYIAETLHQHGGLARDLIEWFRVRFDPDRPLDKDQRAAAEQAVRHRLESALGAVQSLDEDRILRHYINLLSAIVRTNYFQRDAAGAAPATLAFKLSSKDVDALPEPRPFREIWVYSPRVEGIHLRFAPIARGGIRWSDRAQDFRTEVLGLCKAQQVKNTVIVPAGAKGGFVPKQIRRGASREETLSEGTETYKLFISSLLAITDNIESGRVVPPARVVRHEADDPYLVVAADKGTATFSDTANALSAQYGHWLGDAFASGGSVGYDHKKMAITARGAWECVKRHFREMDVDIQSTPFTVAGVGDMSGDVFGNGMLLSPAIRLVAAFDHRDIFLDPSPDLAASLAERRRLFELRRSSWQDYDKSKLSAGGGIYPRSSKSIPLTEEVRRLLGVTETVMAPNDLMRAILKLDVDLLWFGGIGTYVRATAETDEQVGDRANDGLRVTGAEVRAKVVGEGANLGLTQRGRMEFSARGGRLNTDFIDNSAGVNSSDQEVNIKIAISPAVQDGRLDTSARASLLVSMTDDVARACLANNYQQSLALSLAERTSARDIAYIARLMRALEKRGLLDRKLEALPEAREMTQRQTSGQGMLRPELAVLLSQAKIMLNADLLASGVPDDPACEPLLIDYFPPALQTTFRADLKAHRLRREIVATAITNDMINQCGPAIAVRLSDETGFGAGQVASAFLAASAIFDLPTYWAETDALDGRVAGQVQLELYARLQDMLIEQTAALVRVMGAEPGAAIVATYRPGVAALRTVLSDVAPPRQREQMDANARRLAAGGVPSDLARRFAGLDGLSAALKIARTSRELGRPLDETARTVMAVSEHLRVDDLKARAAGLKVTDYYDRLAASGALATLEAAAQAVARDVLRTAGSATADFEQWVAANGTRLARAKQALDEIAGSGEVTVSRLTVAASQVRDLAGA